MRHPCALIGALLWGLNLPLWANPSAPNTKAIPAATPPMAGDGEGLSSALALCEMGRLGQPQLAFLTVFILIGCFVFFLQIDHRLVRSGWDIRRALSEPIILSLNSADKRSEPLLNNKGEPVMISVLEPSVSRLIALAGLIMLILFYFGFGVISVYHFGRTCQMPGGIDRVTTFLYSGLTFFAPYIATQLVAALTPRGARLRSPAPPTDGEPTTTIATETPAQNQQHQPSLLSSDAQPRPQPHDADGPPNSIMTRPSPRPMAALADVEAPAVATDHPADARRMTHTLEVVREHAYSYLTNRILPGITGILTKPHGGLLAGLSMVHNEADQHLLNQVETSIRRLSASIPHWEEMSNQQQSALLCFAWNFGDTFFHDDVHFHTLNQFLRNREWGKIPDALMLYSLPGSAVHESLLERRNAEAGLWRKGLATAALPAAGEEPAKSQFPPNILNVPYCGKPLLGDSEDISDSLSASCAMLACFWGRLVDNDASSYYQLIRECRDSSDGGAQIQALQALGLNASFHHDGNLDTLKAEIDAGRPVAVGWLQYGLVTAPYGGGHWSVGIGYDEKGFWMNDPDGICDLNAGGYAGNDLPLHTAGRSVHCSYQNWLPRWMPGGNGGWYLTCHL